MNYKPSVPLDQLRNPFTDAKRLLARCDEDNGALINTNQLFLPNAKRVESDRLELYTLEDFLDEDECAQFVQLIRSSLKPSGLSSYEKDSSYRTSRTCGNSVGFCEDDGWAVIMFNATRGGNSHNTFVPICPIE